MIDGGVLIIIVSLAIMFTPRGHGMHIARRQPHSLDVGVVLRSVYPPAMPTPQLTELVVRADEALERDRLMRGVRGVTASYDHP